MKIKGNEENPLKELFGSLPKLNKHALKEVRKELEIKWLNQ